MIHTVDIRGFRNITSARLELSPQVTLVLGENGAGKSSLANAILYDLAGWCAWTDMRGAGAASLIQHGKPHAMVSLEGDMGIVSRIISPQGSKLTVGVRSGKDASAALDAALPVPSLLTAMLRSDGFVGKTAQDQSAMLFSLAGGEADADWFAERLTEVEREALGDALATTLTGRALADALKKVAFTTRTEANRNVNALETLLAQASPEPVPADAEKRKALLVQQAQEDKAAVAVWQNGIGEAEAEGRSLAVAKERQAGAQARVDRLTAEVDALGEKPAAPTDEEIEAFCSEVDRAAEALRARGQEKAFHQAQADQINSHLHSFIELGYSCFLGDVACPLSKEDQNKAMADAASDRDNHLDQVKQLTESISRAQTRYDAACTAHRQAGNRRAALSQWNRVRDDVTTRLNDANVGLADAAAEYQAAPTYDLDDLRAKLQSAQDQLDIREGALRNLQRMMAAVSAQAGVGERLLAARDRAMMLDDLVEKLSPSGLPAQAMAKTVGCVTEAVNKVLSNFTDFSITLDDEVLFVTRGDVSVRAGLLSESELLRVGAAIQVAFAVLTEWGFVIVDAADRLDPLNRRALLDMLMASGVQALVLATPLDDNRPVAEGLTVYDLVNGRLTKPGEAGGEG